MTNPKGQGDEVEELRQILFGASKGFVSRAKDYDIILDEKGVDEVLQTLHRLIIQKQVEARKEWAQLIAKKYRQLPHDKITDPYFVAIWLDSFDELKGKL